MSDEVVQLGGGWTLTVTNKPGGVSTFELWDPLRARAGLYMRLALDLDAREAVRGDGG